MLVFNKSNKKFLASDTIMPFASADLPSDEAKKLVGMYEELSLNNPTSDKAKDDLDKVVKELEAYNQELREENATLKKEVSSLKARKKK